MKTFTFSGFGVQSQTFQYGFHMTSAELAAAVGLSVVAVEAMTEDEVKVLVQERRRAGQAWEVEGELDWPYNPEYVVDDDFEVEIDEEE